MRARAELEGDERRETKRAVKLIIADINQIQTIQLGEPDWLQPLTSHSLLNWRLALNDERRCLSPEGPPCKRIPFVWLLPLIVPAPLELIFLIDYLIRRVIDLAGAPLQVGIHRHSLNLDAHHLRDHYLAACRLRTHAPHATYSHRACGSHDWCATGRGRTQRCTVRIPKLDTLSLI